MNNDPESANFFIKHGLQFCAQKPHEFIKKIKDIVETQQRNEDRAVFGKGQYRLREEFEHLGVDDHHRSQLSHLQMKKKLSLYLRAGMKEKKDVMAEDPGDENEENRSISEFEKAVRSSNILNVPAPILDGMISKAGDLFSTPGNVIQTPGATDGSYVVAGSANRIHSVKPGKGGSWTCDRTCINRFTKMCEHTLAVAHVSGSLKEFLAWFGRTRKRPNMMGMIEDGGPKSAGRKPSTRKRSNAKSRPINEYIDLLDREEHIRCESIAESAVDTSFPSMASFPFQQQRPAQPIASSSGIAYRSPSQSSSSHLMSSQQQVRPMTSCPGSVYRAPFQPRSTQSMSSQYQVRPTTSCPGSASRAPFQPRSIQSMSSQYQVRPTMSCPGSVSRFPFQSRSSHSMSSPYPVRPTTCCPGSVYRAPSHTSSVHSRLSSCQGTTTTPRQHYQRQLSGIARTPPTPVECYESTPRLVSAAESLVNGISEPLASVSAANGSTSLPNFWNDSNKFNLKWVSGTRVSKCYGCDGKINNPPEFLPDDLIIVYRDVREYRDRMTGQLQRSPSAQNVHFHLRA